MLTNSYYEAVAIYQQYNIYYISKKKIMIENEN